MIADSYTVDAKEVLKCLIAISEELTPDQIEKYKQESKLVKTAFNTTKNGRAGNINASADSKASTVWNREQFLKNLNDIVKPDWTQVIMALDNADVVIDSKKLFTNVFECFAKAKQLFKAQFPQEIVLGRWKHIRSQVFFLENLFTIGKPEMIFFNELKSKKKASMDFQPNFKNNQNFSPGKIELWSCLDLVERLIELSDSAYFMKVKTIIDDAVKKCPDIFLVSLTQIKPIKGGALFDEVFSQLFPEYFNNYANSNSLINSMWKNNPSMLTRALAQIYKTGNNSINLSKILDICLSIKNSLPKILSSDDFYFTISLAVLAAKRDFLHLDNWLPEKITSYGNRFVSSLVDYLDSNLMAHLRVKDKSNSKLILEQSHLNKNSLAVIFDRILSDKELSAQISKANQKKASEIYKELIDYFPDFSRLKSKETEKEANILLTKYYEGKITIEELAKTLESYKNSNQNKEH